MLFSLLLAWCVHRGLRFLAIYGKNNKRREARRLFLAFVASYQRISRACCAGGALLAMLLALLVSLHVSKFRHRHGHRDPPKPTRRPQPLHTTHISQICHRQRSAFADAAQGIDQPARRGRVDPCDQETFAPGARALLRVGPLDDGLRGSHIGGVGHAKRLACALHAE